MFEDILVLENLANARKRVKANEGAPGIAPKAVVSVLLARSLSDLPRTSAENDFLAGIFRYFRQLWPNSFPKSRKIPTQISFPSPARFKSDRLLESSHHQATSNPECSRPRHPGWLARLIERFALSLWYGCLELIGEVMGGGSPMSATIARMVVQSFKNLPAPAASSPDLPLTDRERAVLEYLAQGYLYKEIADIMKVSWHTVHNHIRHIYEKLHVRSRSQAVAKLHGR